MTVWYQNVKGGRKIKLVITPFVQCSVMLYQLGSSLHGIDWSLVWLIYITRRACALVQSCYTEIGARDLLQTMCLNNIKIRYSMSLPPACKWQLFLSWMQCSTIIYRLHSRLVQAKVSHKQINHNSWHVIWTDQRFWPAYHEWSLGP